MRFFSASHCAISLCPLDEAHYLWCKDHSISTHIRTYTAFSLCPGQVHYASQQPLTKPHPKNKYPRLPAQLLLYGPMKTPKRLFSFSLSGGNNKQGDQDTERPWRKQQGYTKSIILLLHWVGVSYFFFLPSDIFLQTKVFLFLCGMIISQLNNSFPLKTRAAFKA